MKNFTKLIEAYNEGILTTAEQATFDKLMKENSQFRAEADAYQQLYTGLGALHLEDLQNEMNAWETEAKAAPKTKETKIVSISPFRKYMSMAAAIAMLLCVPMVYQSMQPSDPFEQHFNASMAYAIHTASVRDSKGMTSSEQIKKEAFSAYQNKDYKTAIVVLEAFVSDPEEKKAKGDSQSYLILGISQMVEGLYTDAIPNLEVVIQNKDVSYRQEAEWMWALAQYKSGNSKEAKKMLQQIVKNKNHQHQSDAKTFLKKM